MSLTIIISGTPQKVDSRVRQQSDLINNLLTLNLQDGDIIIDHAPPEAFKHFLTYCEINQFADPIILVPIRTNYLEKVLDQKNYEFMSQFDWKSAIFKQLCTVAEVLVCKGLMGLCAAVVACKIYFEDTHEAYLAKKKELQVEGTVTFEDQERYKDYLLK